MPNLLKKMQLCTSFSSQSLSQEIASQNFVGICAVDDDDEKDDPTLKLVFMELNHIGLIAFIFPQIRAHSKQICDRHKV